MSVLRGKEILVGFEVRIGELTGRIHPVEEMKKTRLCVEREG